MRERPGRARDSTPPSVVMATGGTREKPSRVRDSGGSRSVSGVALVGSRSLVGPKNSRIEAVVEYHLSSSSPPPPTTTACRSTAAAAAAAAATATATTAAAAAAVAVAAAAAAVAAVAAVADARRCKRATEGRHHHAHYRATRIQRSTRARERASEQTYTSQLAQTQVSLTAERYINCVRARTYVRTRERT